MPVFVNETLWYDIPLPVNVAPLASKTKVYVPVKVKLVGLTLQGVLLLKLTVEALKFTVRTFVLFDVNVRAEIEWLLALVVKVPEITLIEVKSRASPRVTTPPAVSQVKIPISCPLVVRVPEPLKFGSKLE